MGLGLASVLACATSTVTPSSTPASAPRSAAVVDPQVGPPGRVVFVLSSAGLQTLANGKQRATGFFLSEFFQPYRALRDAGYDIEIATVDGRPPVVDPESLELDYWDEDEAARIEALAFVKDDPRMSKPTPLREIRARSDEFQGVVVPGGQGVMIDLIDDPDLHAVLIELGRTDRAVGLVCHAPAILTKLPSGQSPFEGRTVTSVSGFEEFYIERFVMKGRAENRRIGKQLRRLGYEHETGAPGKSYAHRDCNLATSQNPFSDAAFNTRLLAALQGVRAGVRCD